MTPAIPCQDQLTPARARRGYCQPVNRDRLAASQPDRSDRLEGGRWSALGLCPGWTAVRLPAQDQLCLTRARRRPTEPRSTDACPRSPRYLTGDDRGFGGAPRPRGPGAGGHAGAGSASDRSRLLP
jgi:hypothetical protein